MSHSIPLFVWIVEPWHDSYHLENADRIMDDAHYPMTMMQRECRNHGECMPGHRKGQPLVRVALWLALAWLVGASAVAFAEEDLVPLSSMDVRRLWHQRLDGQSFVASVSLKMDLAGLKETRKVIVSRVDEDGTVEHALIRFEAPPDLRRTAILYLENATRANDYFLYQASTRRVRRLPSSVADADLFGIDLEFLGFAVAENEPTEIEMMEVVRLSGKKAYRLVERAVESNRRFDRRVTWIDSESFIPLRTEHFIDGKTKLVAETRKVEDVQGILTPTEMYFRKDAGSENREVTLTVNWVDYEREIPEEVFSVFNLARRQSLPKRLKND